MKKTTTYSRKRQVKGQTYNSAAWLNTLQRSTSYSTEPLPGSWLPGTQSAADRALQRVKAGFESLKRGDVQVEDDEPFDLIVHALGVSCIRAGQIAGTKPESNAMLPPLIAGNAAMRQVMTRRRRFGKWQILPTEIEAVDWALEIYETILMSGSPAEMTLAAELRIKSFAGRPMETFSKEETV